ncbi:MAG: cadherin-like beta sandwich domain-containing protein [Clostridia bacterium]|nr:cadherin-like beta sandwich domain-containing protein [Clostridia bacterium]
MKKSAKLLSFFLTVVLLITTLSTSAFAKDFAPKFDISNPGIQTQYIYSENDVSWIRKLVVKEDMLSPEGIATEAVLHPVTDYPYTTDAPHFKAEVEECTKTYTLDEDSQRAAYLYLIKQVGALSLISEPTVSDQTKADWLRSQGIVITEEEEQDPEKVLMISALYAMMRNDLYYVYTGEHLTIPEGTSLEQAIVIYLASLSGQGSTLASFIYKFFGHSSFGNLEDYMYYTSLMALYTNGYVNATEIPQLSRNEVYRRVAIMTIRGYGLAIDSEKATHEELQQKYLTAMLGTHYKVSLDPESLAKASNNQSIAYYILQRMAYEDAKLTISQTKYSFENCFKTVLQKTDRFDLKKEFYSDVYEYNVYLESNRSNISVNPTPLTAASVVTINGKPVIGGEYAKVEIKNVEHQVLNIVSRYTVNGKTTTSLYKLNVYQGTTPPPSSNITGIVPTYKSPSNSTTGNGSNSNNPTVNVNLTLPNMLPYVSQINGAATNLVGKILSLNDKGQLVDQQGNVISQATYETLPEGYKYVLGDDGIIKVVLIDDTTSVSENDSSDEGSKTEKTRKMFIIVSSFMCIALVFALILTLVLTKKNRNKKTSDSKTKARKAKEKAKKAKLEAREARRQNKKK